ncbi:MAG: N-acetylmuramoyl-L-alanine amidase [Lachnospiraceae bacterium]|nr:N-acetylmuramoyl-L-alanine amidase [Lachnospiraceae bacterium]
MIHNFIVSWFRREAGLLFFTNKVKVILACVLVCSGLWVKCCVVMAAQDEPAEESSDIVVVIDPGHGGKNLGGEYEDYTEKEMTLIVARAMKEELDKYDGITVYLTRDNDKDLDLEERAEYAKSVGADFLFCLHFNLSEHHTLFGAETWISAYGEEYSRGYTFANVEMELLEELGLYSRGIKTRLNDKGEDYYGIIRHSTARDIPCVLIEHCHLDQENDKPFYDHNEKLQDFGKLDAEAVAKYYGLKSDILGKDYSNYKNIEVATPLHVVSPDKTEPDVCIIELVEQNKKNGNVTLSVSAADYDSGMLYYTYSYDGGQTFSELQRWPDKSKDTFEFTFNVPSGIIPQVLVNAYNGYDLYTTSNALNLSSVSYESDKDAKASGQSGNESEVEGDADGNEDGENIASDGENTPDSLETSSYGVRSEGNNLLTKLVNNDEEQKPATIVYFIKVCLICIVIVLAMIWSILLVIKRQKRKMRRRQSNK